MALRPILLEGDARLRQKAKKISRIDRSLLRLVDDMFETMRAAPGIGLAAPQVGVPLRVIVVEHEGHTFALFNPEIVRSRGETVVDDEGCLSIPQWFGPVARVSDVTVKGQDANGKKVRFKLDGLVARALMHEIDHLDGVLFTDRVEDRTKLRQVEPEDDPSEGRTAGPSEQQPGSPGQDDQDQSDEPPQPTAAS